LKKIIHPAGTWLRLREQRNKNYMIKNKKKNEHFHYDENRMGNGSASSPDKEDVSSYDAYLQPVKTNGIMDFKYSIFNNQYI
jgi:hypothetical protein